MDLSFKSVWAEHSRLVTSLARKLTRNNADRAADLLTVAQVALWEKVRTYDPSRGTTLWQHAYLRVRGAMVDELRKQDPLGRYARAAGERGESWRPWTLVDRVGLEIVMDTVPSNDNPEETAVSAEEARAIRKHLRRLAENHQYILRRTYLEGATLAEVAVELGITESRVCQLRSEALRKIREEHMIHCYTCQKSYLDGPSKCPKCKGPIRRLPPGERPPWETSVAAPPAGRPTPRAVDPEQESSPPALPARPPAPIVEAPLADEEVEDREDLDAPAPDSTAVEVVSEGVVVVEEGREAQKYMITYLGKTQGPVEWSRELGLSEKTIYARIAKKLPAEQVLAPSHPGKSDTGERIMIDHDGKSLSVIEWSELTGIKPATIIWRHRAGWSPADVLALPRPKRPPGVAEDGTPTAAPDANPDRRRGRGHQPELHEHEGVRLTIPEWAKIKKLREDTIYTRLKRGWTLARALDTPETVNRAEPLPEPDVVLWDKSVRVVVNPRTISLLAALSSCNPGSVEDETGVLSRVAPLARELEQVEAEIKRQKERQAVLMGQIAEILRSGRSPGYGEMPPQS